MEKRRLKKPVKITLGILIGLGITLIILFFIYLFMASPVDSKSRADVEIKIKKGMRTGEIAHKLKQKELIRSELVFMIETKLSGQSLKASTYMLKKNMSLKKIVETITSGNKYDPNLIRITFKDGEPIKKYMMEIATNTNYTYDDVEKVVSDKAYLQELINKYDFLTEDILNDQLYYGLEGYLAPNTYEFNIKKASVQKIIETMLDQRKKELDKYKDKLSISKKSYHELFTVASILQLEGTNTENRKMIAGIFDNRIALNMSLGSDVTTYYALQVEMKRDLTSEEFSTINPYNTRAINMRGKLPVGPICNPGIDSIEAAINPTDNEYLFFVADKKGNIYYTKTGLEHDNKVNELKKAGLWIW